MRVVFMGTPDFAVPCLEALIAGGHEVMAVFSQPDKPVGRKQILTPPPVKVCAVSHKIPVYQPVKLKDSNAVDIIQQTGAQAVIVVAYGKILPPAVLKAAPLGCINVHASLLPYYRGAAPIQRAILNGETETGVTVMQMDEGLDTGDILLVKKTPIDDNETAAALFNRLSSLGADALIEVLALAAQGGLQPQPQPAGDFGYAAMITKALSPIDWSRSAADIHNQVRGLQTWPVAETVWQGKQLKIHQTRKSDRLGGKAGEVIENNKCLLVSCGDGKCLEILELQLEGKKRMTATAFLQGAPLEIGTILGD